MNITHETTDTLSGVIKMEINQEDYQEQYQKELRDLKRKAVMPGFRPGKVPTSIIEKKYGTAVLVEEVNKVVSTSLENYIRDNNLNLLGYPLARQDDTNIDFTRDRSFVFSFDVAFIPEVNVDLEAIEPIESYDVVIDDAALQPFIERGLDEHGKFIEKETIEADDSVEVQIDELDADGQINKDGISNKTTILLTTITDESFREKLVGSKVGTSFTFDPLKITEGPDAAAAMLGIDKEEAEKISGDFSMEILKIEQYDPAQLNEEFFNTVFPNDQLNTEEEFKERLRQEVKSYYDNDSKQIFARRAFDQLIEINDLQLPDEFLKKWLFANNDGKLPMDDIEKNYDDYHSAMKMQLVQDALMKKYPAIVVSEHDVRSEIMNQFRKYFMAAGGAGNDDEELDKQLIMLADNYMQKNKEEVRRTHDNLYNDRIANLMIEHVKQTKVEVTPDDLKEKVASLNESSDDHDHEYDHDHDHDHDHEHDSDHSDGDK
jgi:trigger factor